MIVAQEKTGYHGFSSAAPRPKKIRRIKPVSGGARLVLTGLILACFMVGVLITYYCSQVFALGYQISRLQGELEVLRVENHNLDEEVHRLTSLERVEYLATNKLGMVKPDSNNVLVVTVAGETPPTSAAGPDGGQVANSSPAGEEKSRLIRAFTELVNRLENKIWLGRGPGAGSGEGTNANNKYPNNKYPDPEENNRTTAYYSPGVPRADLPPGLASAC